MEPQRRGRRIAMTDGERDAFLGTERVCRVATVGADGQPHATPLWFVWLPSTKTLWLYSIVRSQRWVDLSRDPRVGVVMDAGSAYQRLRGVEISGRVAIVGEVPRVGQSLPELEEPEHAFARKYGGNDTLAYDGRHAWLRVQPEKVTSWDFRKLAAARAPS
ncbi:MAG TPA: pyridoxamine 5'-phosphate oxidase family protein [Acidimicrobiales bacterium]|nr:pyridoxamine 5'-phosphate oxidase family protein [Acidimicrobiales bacterium]